MRLSSDWAGDRVPSRHHDLLLSVLVETDDVRLDGTAIRASRVPLDVVAHVESTGVGWRLHLRDGEAVSAAWEGDPALVLADGVLHPRGHGRLTELQRHQLRDPLLFSQGELPRLTAVSRQARFPVAHWVITPGRSE